MDRTKALSVAVMIGLGALGLWRFPQLKAAFMAPPAVVKPSPTPIQPEPTPEASPTPEATPEEEEPALAPTPEIQPRTKCLDGSDLTVTSRNSNQTNFKCSSGAIGAYLNRAEER